MDRNILRQYLSGLAGANNRFLLENSRALGNLPQNIVYNGLVYTLNLRENAFVNQFGHRIDASAAPAFITEARAFEQQNVVALDLSSASSDSSSSRPQPQDLPAIIINTGGEPNPSKPNTGVILTWDIPEGQDNNVDTFTVLRSTDPKGPFTEVKGLIPKGARATFDDGLTPNTTYYYQIEAIYKGNPGTPSTIISVKTAAGGATPTGITAPSGLTALNVTQTGLNLRWVDNSTNEIGFFVEESVSGSTFTLIEAVGPGVTFVGVKGLTQDTIYSFRVQAYGTGSTSGFSTVNTRTLPTLPAAPTGLSLLVGGTSQIGVSWTDNSTNEQFFNVQRSTDGTSYPFGITLPAGSTTYLNTGLSAGQTYWYRVNAQNTGGTSAFAGPEFAITLPIAPSTPSFTSISGTTNSITLNWSDVANETGYGLYRSVDNGASYPLLVTLAANTTTYTNTSLSSGTTYFYKLDAFNAGGTSALSGATSFTTAGVIVAPAAPTALSVYSSVPETKNFLRYTEGFTTGVSQVNGGWQGTSTTVSIDNSVLAPDGSTGAALLTVTSPTVIGGINSIISEAGVTANDLWTASVWLRGKSASCGGINIVARDPSQQVIPSTLKILSGPGTVIPSSVGETHWNGVTGLSSTEWTRIAWNNITGWGPTGFQDVILRLTVNFYNGTVPSAVTGDSIYVWGAQYERNPYPTAYLAATGGSFSTRAFQGFTSQANLYWTDNSNNETGFLIERSTNDVTYAGVTSVAANTTIYSDSGLSAGSTYFYRVSAFNAGGTSSTTKSPSVTTYPNPPATPSFTSISGTTNSITLNWNNVANETGYGLYRSTTLAGTYTGITTLGANVTTFVNTGLTSGDTFFYKIDAFNSGGTSALSGATSFTTLVTPVPTAPSNLRFTNITSSRISIAWNDNSSNETGFVIQDSLAGVTYNTLDTVGIGVTNYESRGLSAGTTYYFRVAAFNSGGTSSFAGPTFTRTYSEILPEVPDFNANAFGEDTIILDWGWTGDPAMIDGFELLVGNSPLTGLTNVSSDVRGYIHTGLTKGLTYTYEIRAYQSTNYSPPVTIKYKLGVLGPSELSPNDPVGFTASSISTDQINLSWTAPTPSAFYGSATGYQIYRTESGKGYRIVASTTGATFYAMTGLTQDVFYEFKILAYNSGGPSGLTGPISSRTRPPAPTGLTAVSGSTSQINLFWNGFTFGAPASSFYNIYRSIDNSTFNLSATAAASATSYINLGLSAGTTYWYKLAAQNSGGTSTFSGTAFAITQQIPGSTPSAPTGFTATDAGINSVTLQWTDTATNEDGFLIYYRGIT